MVVAVKFSVERILCGVRESMECSRACLNGGGSGRGEGRGGNVSLGAYHPLPLLRKLTVCDGKEI